MNIDTDRALIKIVLLDERTDNKQRLGVVANKIFGRLDLIAVHTIGDLRRILDGNNKIDNAGPAIQATRNIINILIVGHVILNDAEAILLDTLAGTIEGLKVFQCKDMRVFHEFNLLIGKLLQEHERLSPNVQVEEDKHLYVKADDITILHFNCPFSSHRVVQEKIRKIAETKRGENALPINEDLFDLYQDMIRCKLYKRGSSLRRNAKGNQKTKISLSGIGAAALRAMEDYLSELYVLTEGQRIYKKRQEG